MDLLMLILSRIFCCRIVHSDSRIFLTVYENVSVTNNMLIMKRRDAL